MEATALAALAYLRAEVQPPTVRAALTWLVEKRGDGHWGTTQALRHVALRPGGDHSVFRVSFWAADWTPWRALDRVRVAWPGLRIDIRPIYEGP